MRESSGDHANGIVVWMTGLSGAGKTTLAYGLRQKLLESGTLSCVLDGDELRKGLNADLGFSKEIELKTTEESPRPQN